MVSSIFRGVLLALLTVTLPAMGRAEGTPPLLREALDNWLAGKDDWAFTQLTRTLNDDGSVKETRVEHYDPSLPDARRWQLRTVDDRPPTAAQKEAIEDRRNRKPRKSSRSIEEFVDFANAKPVDRPANEAATFEVPLQASAIKLAQTEKIVLLLTVDRKNKTIDQVKVALREPMRVALGLARVTDLDFNLEFDSTQGPAESAKEAPPPSGTARAAVSRLGTRLEYEWTEFRRVKSYVKND